MSHMFEHNYLGLEIQYFVTMLVELRLLLELLFCIWIGLALRVKTTT